MEHSDPSSSSAAETRAPSHISIAVKAMVSAVVFGTIGGAIGRWLGYRGNNKHRQMAQPIMQWSMAGFSAILGAYSTLKASEHVKDEEVTVRGTAVSADAVVTDAEHRGMMAKPPEKSRA